MDQSQINVPKARKKRKANGLNTSTEDEQPSKPRKRKSKFFLLHFKKCHPSI